MVELSREAVEAFLHELASTPAARDAVVRLFGAERRLIVYGSLAPGGSNHHELQGLAGSWRAGTIRGRLHEQGWGWALGYPCLEQDPAGEPVRAHLFESDDLPRHWARLDAFEGDGYERIAVPFTGEDASWVVGQVYAGSRASEEARR